MTNSETMLSTQSHPGDSSSQSYTTANFKGDGYYGRSDGFHTIQITLTGFLGTLQFEGTLSTEPVDTDWFTISVTDAESNNTISSIDYASNATNSKVYNFYGNFIWLRGVVSNWTDGTINHIKLNH